ncbi:hypothetical protein CCP3SC15_70040 [Gammaproteobacteria bacterium]
MTEYDNLDERVRLASVDCELLLHDVYERIAFEVGEVVPKSAH